jgi:putative alpha-1,2-mannosidase
MNPQYREHQQATSNLKIFQLLLYKATLFPQNFMMTDQQKAGGHKAALKNPSKRTRMPYHSGSAV